MSQATVARVRAKYPTPLGDRHDDFLLEVAAELGAQYGGGGLLKKDAGFYITLPDGTGVASDIFLKAPVNGVCEVYDILQDAEGAANPTFNHLGQDTQARYYGVPASDGGGSTPGPTPPTTDLAPIYAKLAQQDQQIATLTAQNAEQQSAIEQILQINDQQQQEITHLKVQAALSFDPNAYQAAGSVSISDAISRRPLRWDLKKRDE